ncbi:histidine kinase [Aquimarina spinulae]|uniref:tetratricopeptide repeat-containing sensor histidine kinase n=1 Tax=Aquimarina spinulae TaxID=1192023 RepID=UPI000D54B4B4|nr:histidine kinase [Aquimarina spinulae]
MKLLTPIFIFIFSISILGQETNTEVLVNKLKHKVNQSDKGEKLKWMDSLSLFIRNKKEFNYDSIVRYTIEYAFELDSITIATRHTSHLIFYLSNRLGKPEEALNFFEDFINKDIHIKHEGILAELYINGADSHYFTGKLEKAIDLYKIAESHAIKSKDSMLLGSAKEYQADAYSDKGDFVKASLLLEEAEKIYRQINDTTRLILTRNSRANLYSQNGFFKEAEIERNDVIALTEKIKYYPALLSALYNASIDNRKTKNFKKQISNLKKALKYTRESTELIDLYEPRLLNSLLKAYSRMNDLSKAKMIHKEIQKNINRNTTGVFEGMYLEAIASFYYAQRDYPLALESGIKYLEKHKSSKHFENIYDAHNFLYTTYEAMGNNIKAYEHYKKFSKIKDSIETVQKTKALAYYQTLYETEKRDAKIKAQNSEITLLDTKNEIKTQWILFGGTGLFALFAILYLLRSRSFARKKQKLQTQFSRNLIKGQEEERVRLARELHDSVGQKLMLLNRKTKSLDDPVIESLAGNTLEELRTISRGLHPASIEKLGITAAIESLVNEMDVNTDIFFTHDIDNIDQEVTKETSIHLYRIIQEALNNMLKHAEAKAASVIIEKNATTIKAIVKDNGKGFEFLEKIRQSTSLGMKTLMERAKIIHSSLKIESAPNKGTILQLTIPKYS